MNITHLTRRYHPHLGGVETHVKSVVGELLQRSYKVTVITQQFSSSEALREVKQNLTIIRIPLECNQNKIKTWTWFWKNRDLLVHTDIIHVHDVFWWILPFSIAIRNKTFITFHGWEGRYPVPFINKLQRYAFAALSKKTIHVGAWIKEFYWDKPNITIYGGISENNKYKNNKKNNTTQLVFLGRLSKDNDLEMYLRFVDLLKKSSANVTVTWIGDGEYKQECSKYGEVTGMLTDYSEYLEKADFVLASSYLSILEANSLGKQVLAFYSHDLKKRYLETYPIKDGLVIANDVDTLVSVAQEINEYNGQEIIEATKEYTWKHVTDTYISLWK